ncbi:MAG: hypothetical protein ACKVU0_01300 [Saprospiraceae bacterium]
MTKAETREWLEAQILAEHSKAQTMRIVRWVGHDAERLKILMEIFLNNPPSKPLPKGRGYQYIFTQRSSWAVRYVGEKSPEIIAPWLPILVANLRKPNLHDAIKRNTLNVFEPLDFPAEFDDDLADLCFGYLADPKEPIAIRCASMTVLEKICRRVPELKSELRLILEEHLDHGTAGFKSRAKKILGSLGG